MSAEYYTRKLGARAGELLMLVTPGVYFEWCARENLDRDSSWRFYLANERRESLLACLSAIRDLLRNVLGRSDLTDSLQAQLNQFFGPEFFGWCRKGYSDSAVESDVRPLTADELGTEYRELEECLVGLDLPEWCFSNERRIDMEKLFKKFPRLKSYGPGQKRRFREKNGIKCRGKEWFDAGDHVDIRKCRCTS